MASVTRLLLQCTTLASVLALAGSPAADAQVWRSDRGDGSYANPPLNADYPDPDIIRVGADFYFASTTFADAPGLTLLHSRDLVNWDIVSHLLPRLDGSPTFDLADGGSYRHGIYAPSLRYRDGVFYVAVTPVGQPTRIYRTRNPRGPWTHVTLDRAAFDPALFFDDDGAAYLATSIGSDGTITLHTLDRDVTRITASRIIHYNKGAEGSKLLKRNGYYYLFNAIPGKLALTVSRARRLDGPWETRAQIDDTTGGHQGALVDLPDGGWYGFVMRDSGAIGRVTNISPVFWQDDWRSGVRPTPPAASPMSRASRSRGSRSPSHRRATISPRARSADNGSGTTIRSTSFGRSPNAPAGSGSTPRRATSSGGRATRWSRKVRRRARGARC